VKPLEGRGKSDREVCCVAFKTAVPGTVELRGSSSVPSGFE
jgi:hypothetical protein